MSKPSEMIQALVICRNGDEHRLCVHAASHGVPRPLRCPHSSHGGGGTLGCLPAELAHLVDREFRDDPSQAMRRGYVLVRM